MVYARSVPLPATSQLVEVQLLHRQLGLVGSFLPVKVLALDIRILTRSHLDCICNVCRIFLKNLQLMDLLFFFLFLTVRGSFSSIYLTTAVCAVLSDTILVCIWIYCFGTLRIKPDRLPPLIVALTAVVQASPDLISVEAFAEHLSVPVSANVRSLFRLFDPVSMSTLFCLQSDVLVKFTRAKHEMAYFASERRWSLPSHIAVIFEMCSDFVFD